MQERITSFHPAYKAVAEAFERNFAEGWEEEGAAFAAFVDGVCVVDLWGGYADKSCGRKWRENTLTNIFSCTKSLAAICVAMEVEAGNISYSDCISKHWPAFGQNGKEEITIKHVLQHQAGLPYLCSLETTLDIEDVASARKMDEILERETPMWKAGTTNIYHALTFGWILDGLFRRMDSKQRTIGEYFKEKVADRHNIDVYIGKTSEVEYRIARVHSMTKRTMIKEFFSTPAICRSGFHTAMPNSHYSRMRRNLCAVARNMNSFNNPHLMNPTIDNEMDGFFGERLSKGHGFLYTRSPLGEWQIGHLGFGGQSVKVDVTRRISFAYLTNALKAGQGQNTITAKRLEQALYNCWRGGGTLRPWSALNCLLRQIVLKLFHFKCRSAAAMKVEALLFIISITAVHTGGVGECRTECIERNEQKIVRVHLKEDWVMVGLCRNATLDERAANEAAGKGSILAVVNPFICNRNIGLWNDDELDEEGIVDFPVLCPSVYRVSQRELDLCPR